MAQKRLTRAQFLERLLSIMDRKHHWAWPIIMGPGITKAQLKLHYQQEYLVYVRDFPVLLARVHGQNPPPDVRRMLAENIYEEDTGGLSFGRSHPELFNEMMRGLGFDSRVFLRATLLPASLRYRRWLEKVTASRDWVVGAAALAVFVEGSIKDRQEIQEPSKPKTEAQIEAYIDAHPLIRHHKIEREHMDLIRAHQKVEAGHRQDAYTMVVNYAETRSQQNAVLACVRQGLTLWTAYRDSIAKACKLTKP
ncbi:MAG TPA: iron-containing redox enzyme family protein [Nitrospira sp.]|nr:iron-containing redox enzyme family protein [Nitrospira sp.]HMV58334.1 iron-containing redox enzyme family protein [Nitrospira sp.]HND02590.1 iron-containing redox enzyme family protein [Nitrospira sp.]HNM18519.1 iron-containing redox enzyme family protein [Nitrospira sp.]